MANKFTLIEMLVVISIIGILSTLLLPSLSKARNSALSKVCLSNLKQQGVASYIYADDNEEIFMASLDTGWWNQIFWASDYMPREQTVMTCPSLTYNGDWFSENYVTYGVAVDSGGGNLREGYFKDGDFKGADSKKVESPADFFFFSDSVKMSGGELVQWVNIRWFPGPDGSTQGVHTRHNKAANVWFLDGHAQGHRKGSLKKLGFNSGWTEGNAHIAY